MAGNGVVACGRQCCPVKGFGASSRMGCGFCLLIYAGGVENLRIFWGKCGRIRKKCRGIFCFRGTFQKKYGHHGTSSRWNGIHGARIVYGAVPPGCAVVGWPVRRFPRFVWRVRRFFSALGRNLRDAWPCGGYARCASTHLRALTKASIQGVTSSRSTRSAG